MTVSGGSTVYVYIPKTHILILLLFYLLGDVTRIPEMLANALIEGAGVDTDIGDEDDEMSSPVKNGKHRRNNPGY